MYPAIPHLSGWRRQLLLFAAAYLAYSLGRFVALGDKPVATANARWIVDLEDSLDLSVEGGVQHALDSGVVMWLLNHAYLAAQFVVAPAMLVWLYRSRSPHYRTLRNTILLTWLISLPVYALFPVAPPRLADVGLTDTISESTGVALDSRLATKFYNPLAAVPSLHAGFAFAVSAAGFAAARRPLARAAALAWSPIVALAVVATGNHFVFDIAAGAVITAAGYALARTLAGWRPAVSMEPAAGLVRGARRPLPQRG
jgi:hypothetical protein